MASNNSPVRLCLFGGSFDPVHSGHLVLAEKAHAVAALDRVIFLPCRQSPHKPGQTPVAANHRAAMLKLALADWPWAEVSTWEADREPPSFSWQTVEHFRSLFPGAELFWLLGGDQWAALEKWARPDFLAANLHFLVFPRGDAPVLPKPCFRHTVIQALHPASSTRLRQTLAAGTPPPAGWLPAPVLDYARLHGLYASRNPDCP